MLTPLLPQTHSPPFAAAGAHAKRSAQPGCGSVSVVCLDGLDTGGGKALPWPACVMATAIGWISFVEWIDKLIYVCSGI